MRRVFGTLLTALAFLVLSACGGAGSGTIPAPQSTAQQSSGKHTVTITIDAPSTSSSSSASTRRPQYVSPSTTQLVVNVQSGCPSACVSVSGFPTTVVLTPTSGGCTSTLANTQCELTLDLLAGSYVVTLTAEDATGQALSTAQSIPFTVTAATNNVVALTLAGIPQSIVATPISPLSYQVALLALDGDGNAIVGPGSPSFSVSQTAGSLSYTLAQPTSTAPNVFTATPSGTGSATLTVTASYAGATNGCTQTGAVCSATFLLTSQTKPLFVGLPYAASAYQLDAPYTSSPINLVGSLSCNPSGLANAGMALDSSENLFIACGNSVYEFQPPYTITPLTITPGTSAPYGIALDSKNDLFVFYDSDTVTEYTPPYTGAPAATITNGVITPLSIALNSSGDLFVANGNDTVTEYAPPFTAGPVLTINSTSQPSQVTFDGSNDLFVAGFGGDVAEFTPPYTGAPTIISSGISGPLALAFDSHWDLFVSNFGNNTITEYAPPYTGASLATMASGLNYADSLAVDGAGDLFVANQYGVAVDEYSPPYTGSPIAIGEPEPNDVMIAKGFALSISPYR